MRGWRISGLSLLAACAGADDAPAGPSTSATDGSGTTGSAPPATTTATEASADGTTADTTSDPTAADTTTADAGPPCNGHAHLCDRPLPDVVFPAAHNAFAATDDGFIALAANQHHGVAQQLDDGVRGFLLDVTMDGDATALCHADCAYGSIPHVDVLEDLDAFLAANPREVVIIIYQDDVTPDVVEADYVATGLIDRVYTHVEGAPWPTLGELVDAGTTLFVTAEQGGPPPAWYHHAWDLMRDTPYEFTSVDAFDCSHNRGDPDADILLVNHWVGTEIGLPAPAQAASANAADVLRARAEDCRTVAGRGPTLFAVDFYDVGDLLAVVDELNEKSR